MHLHEVQNSEAMNSVTEKKQRRRSILTKDVMAGIPVLVQQGLSIEAIAAGLGCKVKTLQVRCSQAQISLRGPKKVKGVPLVPGGARLRVQCAKKLHPPTFQLS